MSKYASINIKIELNLDILALKVFYRGKSIVPGFAVPINLVC
jgi:hypothetical protein